MQNEPITQEVNITGRVLVCIFTTHISPNTKLSKIVTVFSFLKTENQRAHSQNACCFYNCNSQEWQKRRTWSGSRRKGNRECQEIRHYWRHPRYNHPIRSAADSCEWRCASCWWPVYNSWNGCGESISEHVDCDVTEEFGEREEVEGRQSHWRCSQTWVPVASNFCRWRCLL